MSVHAEVGYFTFFILVCYLVADICAPDVSAPDYLTVCNPVTLSDELKDVKPPCEDAQLLKGEEVKTARPNSISLQETPSRIMAFANSREELVSCSQSAKTEKR